jgi:DNA polymerase-3 subunit beta
MEPTKITINPKHLLKVLAKAAAVPPSREIVPGTCSVLFDLTNGMLSLTGTNLQTTITARMRVESQGPDVKACIPPGNLLEMLKALPSVPVDIAITPVGEWVFGGYMQISFEKGECSISARPGTDFPKLPAPPSGKDAVTVTLPADVLLSAIQKTIFAAAEPDAYKPAIAGICFEVSPGFVSLVGTDGMMISKCTYEEKHVTCEGHRFTVPQDGLARVLATFDGYKSPVQIVTGQRRAHFEGPTASVTCTLNSEAYPDYEAVIPKGNPHRLTANKRELLLALRRVMLFAPERAKRVTIDMGRLGIFLQTTNAEMGRDATEKIAAQYQGDQMRIEIDGTKLADLLVHCPDGDVTIEIDTPRKAFRIVPEDNIPGADQTMVIMPCTPAEPVYDDPSEYPFSWNGSAPFVK